MRLTPFYVFSFSTVILFIQANRYLLTGLIN